MFFYDENLIDIISLYVNDNIFLYNSNLGFNVTFEVLCIYSFLDIKCIWVFEIFVKDFSYVYIKNDSNYSLRDVKIITVYTGVV